jgi:uncharacterized protein (DUF1501 family)
VRSSFGETPFGRGCLAAARLIEVGVRCVEVTLDGWDSHINNHEIHRQRVAELDPALAGLLSYLEARDLLKRTVVFCGGEFGRTPRMNRAGGRDHWPHGFSIALAGGGIAGGRVVGETSPVPPADPQARRVETHVRDPRQVADIHATILHALGINPRHQLFTPAGRPLPLSEGEPVRELLLS